MVRTIHPVILSLRNRPASSAQIARRTLASCLAAAVVAASLPLLSCRTGSDLDSRPLLPPPPGPSAPTLTFSLAADMRGYVGPSEFRGALSALGQVGAGSFMLSPGDIDPPAQVRGAIDDILGTAYPWFPIIGNHEAETPEDMTYLRAYGLSGSATTAGATNFTAGPTGAEETCYSFDAGGAHFAVINEYYDGSSDIGVTPPPDDALAGNISSELLAWLASDLEAADARATPPDYIFVLGHEPAFVMPDADTGRLRHAGESLDAHSTNRDAFWNLLATRNVTAYICGHTHDFSAAFVGGVFQLDVGHARGDADEGAPSSFVVARVFAPYAALTSYRLGPAGAYERRDTLYLLPLP